MAHHHLRHEVDHKYTIIFRERKCYLMAWILFRRSNFDIRDSFCIDLEDLHRWVLLEIDDLYETILVTDYQHQDHLLPGGDWVAELHGCYSAPQVRNFSTLVLSPRLTEIVDGEGGARLLIPTTKNKYEHIPCLIMSYHITIYFHLVSHNLLREWRRIMKLLILDRVILSDELDCLDQISGKTKLRLLLFWAICRPFYIHSSK